MKLLLPGDSVLVLEKRVMKLWNKVDETRLKERYMLVPEAYECSELWFRLVDKYFYDARRLKELYTTGLWLASVLNRVGLGCTAQRIEDLAGVIIRHLGGKVTW